MTFRIRTGSLNNERNHRRLRTSTSRSGGCCRSTDRAARARGEAQGVARVDQGPDARAHADRARLLPRDAPRRDHVPGSSAIMPPPWCHVSFRMPPVVSRSGSAMPPPPHGHTRGVRLGRVLPPEPLGDANATARNLSSEDDSLSPLPPPTHRTKRRRVVLLSFAVVAAARRRRSSSRSRSSACGPCASGTS